MSLVDRPSHNPLEIRKAQCPYCIEGEIEYYEKMGTFECNKCFKPVYMKKN
jgi:hypothetical protein